MDESLDQSKNHGGAWRVPRGVPDINLVAERAQIRLVVDMLGPDESIRTQREQGISCEHQLSVIFEVKAEALVLMKDEGGVREQVFVSEMIRMEMGKDHATDIGWGHTQTPECREIFLSVFLRVLGINDASESSAFQQG